MLYNKPQGGKAVVTPEEIEQTYLHHPAFHGLVDTLEHIMVRGEIRPDQLELMGACACFLALQHYKKRQEYTYERTI